MRRFLYIMALLSVLCVPSVYSAQGAHKLAKAAEKLAAAGKYDEAREKMRMALADSTIEPDAYALYIAGKVEEEDYRHYTRLLSINRSDPSVDRVKMADALLQAMSHYAKALELDTAYDKKGRAVVKYSPRMAAWLATVTTPLYNAGVAYMNKRMYYPQAYDAFSLFASSAANRHVPREALPPDSMQATGWFYAGVMAYNASRYEQAADAFEKARKLGYRRKEVLLNEMSCLAQIARTDTLRQDSLSRQITRLAAEGHVRFGTQTPLFLQKYVAGLIVEELPDSALHVVDDALLADTTSYILHSMRGALLVQLGDIDAGAEAYRRAAAAPQADFTTLKEAAKTVARQGLQRIETLTGSSAAKRRETKEIAARYLAPAREYALRAQALKNDDEDLLNTLETIDYYMH